MAPPEPAKDKRSLVEVALNCSVNVLFPILEKILGTEAKYVLESSGILPEVSVKDMFPPPVLICFSTKTFSNLLEVKPRLPTSLLIRSMVSLRRASRAEGSSDVGCPPAGGVLVSVV